MRQPRIAPVGPEELSAEQAEVLAVLAPQVAEHGPLPNIFRTLVRHPVATRAFLEWGGYVLSRRNTLPPRERELVILRTGYRCGSGYEWVQHVLIGRRAGLTDEEIDRVRRGPDAPGWSAPDAALLRAVDDLHDGCTVTDAGWQALSAHFTERQCMDVVFTAGQYTQVSMMLNAFGVPLDEGLEPDPDFGER